VHLSKIIVWCTLLTERTMLKARFSKRESKLAKKKKVVRRAWSKEDVRTLKTMAKAKAGVTKISKALKRTTGATAVKAHQLGVSLARS
jgi:hypothetical protein